MAWAFVGSMGVVVALVAWRRATAPPPPGAPWSLRWGRGDELRLTNLTGALAREVEIEPGARLVVGGDAGPWVSLDEMASVTPIVEPTCGSDDTLLVIWRSGPTRLVWRGTLPPRHGVRPRRRAVPAGRFSSR